MLSFLHKLRYRFSSHSRAIFVSVLCVTALVSTSVFTGITAYASRVEIFEDGELINTILTNSESTDEILLSQGIEVSSEDEVVFSEVDGKTSTIKIRRAFEVEISADAETVTVSMVEGTVQDALDKANIDIDENDIVSEELNENVTEGTKISITRVTTDQVSIQEEIPYNSVTVETDQLTKGTTQVQTEGKNGLRTNYYSCVYEDGIEVSRSEEPVSTEVTEEPVDEVILVGTLVQQPAKTTTSAASSDSSVSPGISELALPASLTFNTNGIPNNYSKVITGRGVAYTASSTAKTSTGRTVKPGYVAVNPNVIPYGTELYIVATDGTVYGYAIAADTGGSCMANDIVVDLFMNSTSECYSWGSKTVNIYVLS